MDALKMHKPYRSQVEISKQQSVACSTAEDLEEVCARYAQALRHSQPTLSLALHAVLSCA